MRSSLRDVELLEYTTLSDSPRYGRSSVSGTPVSDLELAIFHQLAVTTPTSLPGCLPGS